MKKSILLSVLFLAITIFATAQPIKGLVLESSIKSPVTVAMVSLKTDTAGASLASTLTDELGKYSLPGKISKGYLEVKCLGYQTTYLPFDLVSNPRPTIYVKYTSFTTNDVVINAYWFKNYSPITHTTVAKEELQKTNLGQDVPYVIQDLPSVVVTSDAGTGIGYTGIRIRGSDPTRINVTVNGIPINDAESQAMFWVNMPDIVSSTENIQVQRGVGSSVNGGSSFGGNINLTSKNLSSTAFAKSDFSVGSFNTMKNNVSFGSGLLNQHFKFEGRLSRIKSDGYIDRGSSDLKSFFVSGSYQNDFLNSRINVFSGKEITYQSWNGVPESRVNGDVAGMNDFIIRNGLDAADAANLLNSGRNYNFFTYDNQVDNYQQDHYQFLNTFKITSKAYIDFNLHYTRGRGYFEEYQKNQTLGNYGISPVYLNTDTINSSNLIRQKWLDNDFYGTTYSLRKVFSENSKLTIGGGWNNYIGGHFGTVVWAQYASNSEINQKYYNNSARKSDWNNYARLENFFFNSKVNTFIDLQYRNVNYYFSGLNDDGTIKPDNANLNFFNPKAGIAYSFNSKNSVFASFGMTNQEPNRDDYTKSTNKSRLEAEQLTDIELNYRYTDKHFFGQVTFYNMSYSNQLVLTGAVNDVGNYTRSNVAESYRRGVELQTKWLPNDKISIGMNLTLSENKIKQFVEFTDEYDADFNYAGQSKIVFNNTNIAFAPAVIGNINFTYQINEHLSTSIIQRYIDKQYLDNTSNESRVIKAYMVTDARVSYKRSTSWCKEIGFNLLLNNIGSTMYSSNGYTYGYNVASSRTQENFFYPQAPFNALGQISLLF
jgi:iron complex outermembrane receptor protein